jgi:23S rRNA (cytosine1962-C5)-methyltransferase
MKLHTLITQGWDDYALVDSGAGRKLERIGGFLIDRPEPQAMWTPQQPKLWDKADAAFNAGGDDDDNSHGRWQNNGIKDGAWESSYEGVYFIGHLTNFRHVGYFPEQCAHWEWLQTHTTDGMKILNLFAYSGVHSLITASKGAQVTHVDASKKAITWAKENQSLNKADWPIRWIVDDAMKFVQREIRRGNKYDGILLDPPKFGRGPDSETWDLFTHLPEMMQACAQILKEDKGSFLLLTSYAIRASALAFGQMTQEALPDAKIECGELFVQEEKKGRLLPTSMYTRAVR